MLQVLIVIITIIPFPFVISLTTLLTDMVVQFILETIIIKYLTVFLKETMHPIEVELFM